MKTIPDISLREVAAAIRAKKLTSTEVVRAHLRRMDERNPDINAVIRRNDEAALARATQADAAASRGDFWGPLHGVPFTAKDMFATRQIPTTFGMPHLIDHQPQEDAALVRRYLSAGAILVGKTNLPTFSYDWQTRHPYFGRCNNPYDVTRTVGGSSGGSAAAVACGMVPFDIGSDVAGSIRVPCHHCHVFGLRPTEDVISDRGHGDVPSASGAVENITVVGPIARTASDLELLFRIATDREPRIREVTNCQGLRVAWSSGLGDVPVGEDVASAMERLRGRLVDEDAVVEDAQPAVSIEEAIQLWGRINGYEMAHAFPWLIKLPGIRQATGWWFFEQRLGEGALAEAAQRGFNADPVDFEDALSRRAEVMETVDAFFERFDLWIAPALPVPPFEHRPTGTPIEVDGVDRPYADLHATYQCSIATFGTPVVSVPIATTDTGLPIGIQLIARRGEDLRLIQCARALSATLQRASPPPGVDTTSRDGVEGR